MVGTLVTKAVWFCFWPAYLCSGGAGLAFCGFSTFQTTHDSHVVRDFGLVGAPDHQNAVTHRSLGRLAIRMGYRPEVTHAD